MVFDRKAIIDGTFGRREKKILSTLPSENTTKQNKKKL